MTAPNSHLATCINYRLCFSPYHGAVAKDPEPHRDSNGHGMLIPVATRKHDNAWVSMLRKELIIEEVAVMSPQESPVAPSVRRNILIAFSRQSYIARIHGIKAIFTEVFRHFVAKTLVYQHANFCLQVGASFRHFLLGHW
jgi:hypothetical protein